MLHKSPHERLLQLHSNILFAVCQYEGRLQAPCGKLDDKVGIVWLGLCLVGCLVADDGTAFIATVDDDISLFGVGLCPYRAENSAAVIRPVAGVDIHMERAKAEGTMIA